ncbi:hypothetical protein AWZ03_004502 [Drosophila navojoa]|uniref:Uncharacterized protein n=1 Tax=Drosophila navojoa TaxID=7232 RepID=A0A484BJQ5_DRONA|nr:hypothetical protein AWZ03_004502 [Drosophila navojoa]
MTEARNKLALSLATATPPLLLPLPTSTSLWLHAVRAERLAQHQSRKAFCAGSIKLMVARDHHVDYVDDDDDDDVAE